MNEYAPQQNPTPSDSPVDSGVAPQVDNSNAAYAQQQYQQQAYPQQPGNNQQQQAYPQQAYGQQPSQGYQQNYPQLQNPNQQQYQQNPYGNQAVPGQLQPYGGYNQMAYQGQYGPVIAKNPGIAAVLSFFWPGAGQVYNGEMGLGITFILLQFVNLLLVIVLIGLLTWPILTIVSTVLAYNSAKDYNTQHGIIS